MKIILGKSLKLIFNSSWFKLEDIKPCIKMSNFGFFHVHQFLFSILVIDILTVLGTLVNIGRDEMQSETVI